MLTFGRWTILGAGTKKQYVRCRCACGTEQEVFKPSLVNGMSGSCGCLRREFRAKHGGTFHGIRLPEYSIWIAMLQRCHNPNNASYRNYGGRGIHVCPEWRESFHAFLSHIGPRPRKGLVIDRTDNDRGYEPGNVRWVTPTVSLANRRPRAEMRKAEIHVVC